MAPNGTFFSIAPLLSARSHACPRAPDRLLGRIRRARFDSPGVPFLALLAAVALVLLTPSPAPANYTEGRLSIGSGSSALTVAVFADVVDAQDGVTFGRSD